IVPLVGPQSAGHVAGPGTAVCAPLGRVRARLLRLAAGSDLATAVRAVVDHLDVPAVISTAHVALLLVVAPGASRRRRGSGWSRRQPVRGSPAAAAGSVSDATDVPIRARRQCDSLEDESRPTEERGRSGRGDSATAWKTSHGRPRNEGGRGEATAEPYRS